jgi:outer membrane protein TolC
MDVKELTLQIKEAKARYGVARSDLFPTLSLSGYKRRLGPNLDETDPSTNLNASISIDFLKNMGWGTLSMMQVQKGRIQEALLNKEKQLNSIQEELAKAYNESNLYRAQRDVALQKMNASLESYRIAGSRLKHGVGLNLDVVQAQKDLTDARLEYQNAVMNYNIAQIKLLYETGQLQPQLLQFGLRHQPAPPQVPATTSGQAALPSTNVPNVASTGSLP